MRRQSREQGEEKVQEQVFARVENFDVVYSCQTPLRPSCDHLMRFGICTTAARPGGPALPTAPGRTNDSRLGHHARNEEDLINPLGMCCGAQALISLISLRTGSWGFLLIALGP